MIFWKIGLSVAGGFAITSLFKMAYTEWHLPSFFLGSAIMAWGIFCGRIGD